MATANVTLTTTYAKIADDGAWSLVSFAAPELGDSNLQTDERLIELATAGSAPAATLIGHVLRSGEGLTPAQIGDGDLYGRVSVFTAATGRTQVVTVS